jgi:hypothetical protein
MMSNLSTYCRDVKFVPWPRPARWEEGPPNVVAVRLTSTVRLAGVLQIEGIITGDDYWKTFSTIGDPSEDVGDTAYRAAKDVLWKLEVTGLWFWQYYGILEPLSSISKTLNFYEVMQGTGSANAKGDAVGRILLEIFATGPAQALQLPAALQDEGGSGESAEDFIKKRYKHAIESGDLNEIEAVHVGLTDQQREGFTRFYGRVKDLKTEIYDVKVQDEGGETVVEFVRDDAFLEIGSGRNIRISLRLSVVLASSAGTWRIKSYRQT